MQHQRRHTAREWTAPPAGRRPGGTEHVEVHLLGRFEVIVDGRPTPARAWTRRAPAMLVKVLALAPGHRLHREQVIDMLWPTDALAVAGPKLHKASHFVRRATGRQDAVVVIGDVVQLFPDAHRQIDVDEFERRSREAITNGDAELARAAIECYQGELLPDDRYEEWALDRRELLRLRHVTLLRIAGRWLDVTEHEPGDEEAHAEVMRAHLAHGDRDAAVLQYQRLARAAGLPPGSPDAFACDGPRSVDGTWPGRRTPSGVVAPLATHPRRVGIDGPVGELVAQLDELARRQAVLLAKLAAAYASGSGHATLEAAS